MDKLIGTVVGVIALCLSVGGNAVEPLRVFDAHMHYNIEARESYPPAKVLEIFRQNNVRGILATSRPNEGSQILIQAAQAAKSELTIVPFIRVYRDRADYGTWHKNPEIVAMIEREYAEGAMRGKVRGIGEFHLHGDEAKSKEFAQIVAFAQKHDLWLHAHSDEAAINYIFTLAPKAKVIWAHTGFSVATDRVAAMMKAHPDLMGELSYRNDITDGGKLSKQWRALFMAYPDRFLLGSDCWVTERWAQYGEIMDSYQRWLAELPRDVGNKIAHRNAERIFAIKLK